MGKLDALAKKHGLEVSKDAPKKSSSLKEVDFLGYFKSIFKTKKEQDAAAGAMTSALDEMAEAEETAKQASATIAARGQEIREFVLNYALSEHQGDNLVLRGMNSAYNVSLKEQFSIKDPTELKAELVKLKQDPDRYLKEETSLDFNYDKMTDDERDKLFKFLSKEFGADRFKLIVTERTKYKTEGLKDLIFSVAKDRAELDALRGASGHYSPTLARRVKGD